MMFRVFSFVLVLVVLCELILILKKRRDFFQKLKSSVIDSLHFRTSGALSSVKHLIYFIVLLCTCLLAVSGFFYPLVLNEPPQGLLLLLHVSAAPLFAVGVALLSLLWAYEHQFKITDLNWLHPNDKIRAEEQQSNAVSTEQKICFWIGLTLSVPVIASIVLSMFQLFGTEGQRLLLQIHRYAALLLVLTVAIHSYFIIFRKV